MNGSRIFHLWRVVLFLCLVGIVSPLNARVVITSFAWRLGTSYPPPSWSYTVHYDFSLEVVEQKAQNIVVTLMNGSQVVGAWNFCDQRPGYTYSGKQWNYLGPSYSAATEEELLLLKPESLDMKMVVSYDSVSEEFPATDPDPDYVQHEETFSINILPYENAEQFDQWARYAVLDASGNLVEMGPRVLAPALSEGYLAAELSDKWKDEGYQVAIFYEPRKFAGYDLDGSQPSLEHLPPSDSPLYPFWEDFLTTSPEVTVHYADGSMETIQWNIPIQDWGNYVPVENGEGMLVTGDRPSYLVGGNELVVTGNVSGDQETEFVAGDTSELATISGQRSIVSALDTGFSSVKGGIFDTSSKLDSVNASFGRRYSQAEAHAAQAHDDADGIKLQLTAIANAVNNQEGEETFQDWLTGKIKSGEEPSMSDIQALGESYGNQIGDGIPDPEVDTTVNVQGFGDAFKITIPASLAHTSCDVVVDLDVVHNHPLIAPACSWLRQTLIWGLTLVFCWIAGKTIKEQLNQVFNVPQAKATFDGSSIVPFVGIAKAFAMATGILLAIVALPLAIVAILESTGIWTLSSLAVSPFASTPNIVSIGIYFVDAFIPIAFMLVFWASLVSLEYLVAAAFALCGSIIKLMAL